MTNHFAASTRADSPDSTTEINSEQPKPLHEDRFATVGAYGFKGKQIALLAALVTEDPLLLIGNSGTGKTYLLNSISEALGLEHRHYNASLIAFDDLVGFPYPDEERTSIRFLQTPATIWGAESVLIDEISRCKPEHQNRLFSLIHERRIQGIALDKLRYRWAAMNPCSSDQESGGEYLGSEPLDPALADRFSVLVDVGDWDDMTEQQQRMISDPGGEGLVANDGGRLLEDITSWRAEFEQKLEHCPTLVMEYARVAAGELNTGGIRISPRRVRLLARTLLAATVIEAGNVEQSFHTILKCSIPHRAWGERPAAEKLKAAHRVAWDLVSSTGAEKWLNRFHLKRTIATKVRYLVEFCPDKDSGTLAIEQLLANGSPEQVAAFALVVYPAAVSGGLRIGAEGVADLGVIANELLTVNGTLSWQERLSEQDTVHAEMARLSEILDALPEEGRRNRARQLFYWALLNDVTLENPELLEKQFNQAFSYLAEKGFTQ